MPGSVIRALPLTDYDFTNVQGGQEQLIFFAEHIDVSQFTLATLMVRGHDLTIPGAAALKVQVVSDGHTDEDPSQKFRDTSAFLAEISMDNQTSAPFFRTAELTSGRIGSMISVAISATRDSNLGTFTATLSIDIAMKS